RLPLFPAILTAFNVTDLKHSVFGLIVFHACLAVGSCWLFYRTARLLAPYGALLISFVFIGSLLPIVNVKYIMTEQLFFFETTLTIYGMVAFLLARTNRAAWVALACLGFGTALMTLTRPQGAYVIPVVFGLLAVLLWRKALTVLLCAVLAFGAVASVQAVDKRIRSGAQTSVATLDSSNMTGAMLLARRFCSTNWRDLIRVRGEQATSTPCRRKTCRHTSKRTLLNQIRISPHCFPTPSSKSDSGRHKQIGSSFAYAWKPRSATRYRWPIWCRKKLLRPT